MAKDDDKLEPSRVKQQCKPQLPHGWTVRVSRSYPDRVYYFNTLTGATSWELPGLVEPDTLQPAEVAKKGKSSSSRKKKHHHSHRKSDPTHDRKHHHHQPKLQDLQLSTDGADKDDDLLDLNCEDEDPLESNSVLFTEPASSRGSSLQTPDSGESVSSSTGKQSRRKKRWKQFWDSPSDPELFLRTPSRSEQSQGSCALSSEELEIIRFPRCSRVGRGEPSAAEAAAETGLPELTAPVQTVSSLSRAGVGDTLTSADMGNAFHRLRSGTGVGRDPTAQNPPPLSTDTAVGAQGIVQAASPPSVLRSSSSVPVSSQTTPHSPSLCMSGQSAGRLRPMTVQSPSSPVPGRSPGRLNQTTVRSPSLSVSGRSGDTLNQTTVRSPSLSASGQLGDTLNQTTALNAAHSPLKSVPVQSPLRLKLAGGSSSARSGLSVTVEYRAGLKSGTKEKFAADSSQHVVGSRPNVKATAKAKENSTSPEPVFEFRRGFRPVSPRSRLASKGVKASPQTEPAAPKVVRPAPFVPRVLSTKSTNAAAVSCADKKAPDASSSDGNRRSLPMARCDTGEAGTDQEKTAPAPASKQRKRKSKCLQLAGDVRVSSPERLQLASDVKVSSPKCLQLAGGVRVSSAGPEACSKASSGSGISVSDRPAGSAEDSSGLAGQQSPPRLQPEERRILKGKRRKGRQGQSKTPPLSDTAESERISPQTHQSRCSPQPPALPSTTMADGGLATPSWNAAQLAPSPAGLGQSASAFNPETLPESRGGRWKELGEGLSSSALSSPQTGTSTASTWSDFPCRSATSSPSQPQASVVRFEPSGDAFPFSPASVIAADSTGGCLSSAREGDVAMEVDDEEEDQIMMDLQELRENFNPDMNVKAVGTLTESVQQAMVTRPVTPPHGPVAAIRLVYVVVDTNVLIGSLKFVQDLRDIALKDYGRPYLIIPWVVLQELDAMKGSRFKKMSHEKKSQNAVRYLHSCLISQHPRVRGQTPAEASEVMEVLPIQCNDDHILKCCLQYISKYGRRCVLLLTEDLNLTNKAVVMGIKCFSTKSLKPQLTAVALEGARPSSPEDAASVGSTRSSRGSPEWAGDGPGPVSHALRSDKETATNVRGQQQRQQRVKVDKLLCGLVSVLQATLPALVQAEMQEAYGALWPEVVYRKPPWSAYDLALVLQKHWIAVFSLKMDRELKILVEHLATKLRPETATGLKLEEVLELLHSGLELMKGVHKYRPCSDAVRQMEKLLQEAGAQQPEPHEDRATSPSESGHSKTSKRRGKRRKASSSTHCEADSPQGPQSPTTASSSSSPALSSSSLNPSGRRSVEMLEDSSVKKQRQVMVSSPPRQGESPVLKDTAGQGASQIKNKPSGEKEQKSLKTVGAVLASLNSSHSATASAAASSDSRPHTQVPKTITAEEAAAIGELFQAIWSAIYNCCNNVEQMLETSRGSLEVTDLTNTLRLLVPLVKQIRSEFEKCLSFSPLGLERHVDSFFVFCSCLNNFFMHSKIPTPPLTHVTPGNMIAFMVDTKNRVTLLNGLRQLDEMIAHLHSLISRLPN